MAAKRTIGRSARAVIPSLRTKFLFSLLFAVLVVAGLSVYADGARLLEALGVFRWELLPAILGLTLLNYALRFAKWHYYLGQIGVRGLSFWLSFAIFFAGLSMVVTPGKVGEWLKSYFLQETTGTPFFRSAPIIVAERLTDGLAMVLLASGGLVLFQVGWQLVALVLLAALGILVVCWTPPLAEVALAIAGRLPLLGPRVAHLREFYGSARAILSPKNMLIGVALGFVSWFGECFAYYLVLLGLGQPESLTLVVQAAFILAVASLGGSLLLLPGGLGFAEGGITGMAQLLLGMPKELAVTSAILIRLSTLWFGVGLGLVMLWLVTRTLAQTGEKLAERWPHAS
ncbi:MAG: flippase-like domain-containing protein [Chloroflexi bacterium]|nr:flippase-like domain-containing protein [Chloroflexota bacterium]